MADSVSRPLNPLMHDMLCAIYGRDNIARLEAAIAVDRAAIDALSPPQPAANDHFADGGNMVDADEYLIETDALEAERFRIELARDAATDQGDDW